MDRLSDEKYPMALKSADAYITGKVYSGLDMCDICALAIEKLSKL